MTKYLFILFGTAWGISYILIIYHGLKYKRSGIPPFAICSNFAWEISSLLYTVCQPKPKIVEVLIFSSWAILDTAIFTIYLIRSHSFYLKKWFFITLFVFECLFFTILAFKDYHTFLYVLGFTIDVTMAAEWLICLLFDKILINKTAIYISFTKYLGDTIAWIAYNQRHPAVPILGITNFILNTAFFGLIIYRHFKEHPDLSLGLIKSSGE